MRGGIMFDFVTPEDCITFSIMKNISKKACLDQMKLESAMIAILDDKKSYNFMCSSEVEFLEISLKKNSYPKLIKKLKNAVDHYYIDNDQEMTLLLQAVIDEFKEGTLHNKQTFTKLETQITETMLHLIDGQEICVPHFTKSEKTAMEIKKKLFKHMDGKMNINSLSNDYHISTKSLQNAFRSLFDLKPNQFIRLLKLNLVHHELIQSKPSDTTVLRVAQKWGFAHMGRFSKYYTELFGENPSVTLKTINPTIDGMSAHCVERKEEML
jgi:AraC-like DNA-binding protein